MLGDLTRGARTELDMKNEEHNRGDEVALRTQNLAILHRGTVRLDGRILGEDDDFVGRLNKIRRTNFFYYIRYIPTTRQGYTERPYMLVADVMIPKAFRFGTLEELKAAGERRPDVKFVLDNTNIDKWTLLMAKHNPSMFIMLGFDCGKFYKGLAEQYEKRYDKKCEYSLVQPESIAVYAEELCKQAYAEKNRRKVEERKKRENDAKRSNQEQDSGNR